MAAIKGLLAALAVVAPVAALLLITAGLTPGGTWIWPRAWVFLAITALVSGAGSMALAVYRPANFAMRQHAPRKDQHQPWIDAVGLVAFVAYLLAWFAFIPVDVFSLHLLPPPPPLAAMAGGAACLAGLVITQLAVYQNRFATPTVHDQSADGQRVIDTGLYGLALQLHGRSTSESMGDHDSEVMGCRAHRSRRHWSYGRLHCGM